MKTNFKNKTILITGGTGSFGRSFAERVIKFGPKKIISIFLLIAFLGTTSFALSKTFSGLFISRILIGIGVSACLMAPLTGYRIWFAENLQQRANKFFNLRLRFS